MPTTVEVPSAGETLEFPDSMTEDQIRGVLKNRYQLSQQMKADVAAQKMREADKELTSAVGAVAFPKGRDSSAAELLSGIANAPFSMLNETLPHLSEDERRQLAKTSPTLEKIEAASESAGELAPMALPLGALSEGGTIGKGIGLAFGAQAATQVPEAFSRAGEISGDPNATGGEALMADVGAASTLGIAGLGLAGGAMPGKPGAAEVLSRAIDHASMGTPAELDAIKGGKPITIKVEPKPAPVTPVAQPEGEPNAVPERSATPLPVGQTPQDSGEVGARVPGTEEPAGAPPPVEAAPETPPDVPTEEVAPAAAKPELAKSVPPSEGAGKATETPAKSHHVAIYGGKEVPIDYVDDPKREFKVASQRVRDNLKAGEKGYVKTPDGKIYEISIESRMAKPVSTIPETSPSSAPAQPGVEQAKAAIKGNPKVGEPFAKMGDYEFGLTMGGLKERPEMYGVGVRRVGSTGEFESGGYGFHMKPEGVIERWAEKEAARGEPMEFSYPKAEQIYKAESERLRLAAEKKEAEDTARAAESARKRKEWDDYAVAVRSVQLPTGKKTTITATAKDGNEITLTGTQYGDWLITKSDSKYDQSPYRVTHVKSGAGVSGTGFASLGSAKDYVKALIHSKVKTDFKSVEEGQFDKDNFNKMSQVAKAWLSGGDVPDYFQKPTQESPASPPAEKTEPTVKPLGGDVAGASGEAGAGRQGSPTAMKYKLIDQERQQRGEPPLTKPDSVSDQALLDKAMAEMDKDPEIPDKLVRELNSKPRTIEAWERMALLLRKIDLRNEYHKAVAETLQAYEDSKQFPDRKSDMVAAQLRRAQWGEKLDALERASRLSGSEVGRSLRSLQIMANEDYSLASMERDARAAKGGEDLTPQELSEIKRMSDEHAKATADLQRQLDTSRASEREAAAKLEAIKREVAAQPPIPPEVKVIADRLKSYFDQRADAALKRLSGKAWSLGPEIIADLTDLGVSKIISGASEFAGWSAQMLAQFPDKVDKIKPELKKIWDLANKAIDDRIKGERIDHAAQVKQAIKTRPVEEQIASRETAIGEKIASDKKGDITWHIQQLARLFVMQGETDRESLINKVHAVVSKFDPSMTRRDTMDAISGYGDFKQLSKDKISTTLRTLKGQMQQVSKLQDMQEGRPPLKTGVERREVSPEESRLIKLVNESKRQFQIPISDPSTQLKSSLDELKTRMQNRIHDLQDRLDRGDFESKPRRPIELDTRARELQARKNAIEHKFKSAKARWELESRPATEKTFDWVSNARRFSVLSGVNVLAKLAAYSATKIPTMAGAEAAGGVLSRLPGISKIAEKAPSEAGGRMDILSRSVAKGFTQGILDAYQTGTKGESQLRQAFGNRLDLGRHWYNVPQLIHEVIKSPLRRVAFENSLGRRMETAARNGADITDPLTQLSLAKDAYLDSDRALLLEQNRLATGIRNIFKRLEQPDKATGEVPLHGKISATVGRLEFPIMTVPFNFVKQSLVSAFGLASGSYKAAAAFRRGMETLKPEEADAIMRHLKQGSIGGAIMLYGFIDGYNHASDEENSTFGGFYQPGEHRKSTQAGVGGMKVMGHKIPGLLLHNPVLAAGQLGHTIGAITASKINKKTAETHGITVGMIAGTMGLLSDEPLGRNAELVSQLSNVRDADWGVGELEKNMLVPQIMQETSQWLDTDAKGNIIKRKPVTPWQHVETGIPGLRKQVPANPKQ